MMINKRLISTVSESKKYIAGNVICQWISLAANIAMMASITALLAKLYEKTCESGDIITTLLTALAAVIVRFICTTLSSRMSYLSSKAVKKNLREMIYKKLLRLGTSYTGFVKVGGTELKDISEASLMENFTYISHQSYLFKGTVRENLLMGCPAATDEQLWSVLDRVNLSAFLKSENGLDTLLMEKASNRSGSHEEAKWISGNDAAHWTSTLSISSLV